jgi:hypothetical protein
MAMEKFRAPPLPVPPKVYDQQYITQVIRILGLYFSQLDSQTPNQANSYRALQFIGGDFNGESVTADNVTASTFTGGSMDAEYGDFTNLVANLMTSGSFQGGNAVFGNMTAAQANASLFTGSGREINFPHIAASDSTDQYATATNTPTIVKWDTLAEAAGFTLNVNNTATATYSGVYKIDYSLQFANTANAAHDVYVWLQVNGNDVAKSTSSFTLPARKSAGVPSFLVAYSSITFNVNAGDDIGLWWATDQAYSTTGPVDGVYMEYIPAASAPPYARPAAPSAIGSIVYVSAPDPARTRVTPVGVAASGEAGTPITAVVST